MLRVGGYFIIIIILGHRFENNSARKVSTFKRIISRNFTNVLMVVSRMVVDIIEHVDADGESKDVLSKICG